MLDINELHLQWFDWVMKDGTRPEFLQNRIAYYVAGAEKWAYAGSLAGIGAERERRYLESNDGETDGTSNVGRLAAGEPAATSQPSRYRYDPLDVRQGRWEMGLGPNYLSDENTTEALFGNGLVYETEAFADPVEMAGYPRFVAWMSLDVPDTDFEVMISVVMPDGKLIKLSRDMLRARYRKSPRTAELVTPGTIVEYEFTGFYFVARRFETGSKLRLTLRCPNSIYVQKNYNSGGEVINECGEDARVATVAVFEGQEFPSYLELPVNK